MASSGEARFHVAFGRRLRAVVTLVPLLVAAAVGLPGRPVFVAAWCVGWAGLAYLVLGIAVEVRGATLTVRNARRTVEIPCARVARVDLVATSPPGRSAIVVVEDVDGRRTPVDVLRWPPVWPRPVRSRAALEELRDGLVAAIAAGRAGEGLR